MCMIQIVSNANTKYRYETLKNVDYLVVPVVMLNVGVHAGTVGPLMYTANQMKAAIHSWNLKPVVLNHPAGGSAADPVFLEAASVGILLNTQFNNDELTSEAWIEIDRLETLDADMLADIRAGKVIEVSTGLFAANSGEAGTFNNESYDGEAIDHQPDHLALLANAEGACSIKKGCGLQVQNAATDKTVSNDVYTLTLNASAAALSAIESLGGVILTKNKLSYADVQDKLHIALREKIDGYWEGWILAVYESVVIYRDGSRTFYLNYKVEDDSVTFGDADPVEVQRVEEFRTADGMVVNAAEKFTPKESITMKTKKEKVDELISNSSIGWTEEDRPQLDAMSEKQLDNFFKVSNAAQQPAAQPQAVQVLNCPETDHAVDSALGGSQTQSANQMTMQQAVATLPPEYQQVMNAGLISLNAEKQRLISTIVANEKSDFSEEWLKLQTPELLRGLAKIAAAPVHNDYAALGGGPTPMFAANGSTPAAGQKVEAPPTTEWDQEFAKV